MTSVAILGAGAVGGYFGAHLAEVTEVVVCGRRPLDRLVVDQGGHRLEVEVRSATDPGQVGEVDWVLVAVKAHQTEAVGPWLERSCSSRTHVLVLQNGIEHEERVGHFVGDATVVPAIVQTGLERVGPGHVVRTFDAGALLVPATPGGKAAEELVASTGLEVTAVSRFRRECWRKLCSNSAINPLTALTLQRNHVIGAHPETRALAHSLIRECMAVAAADGFPQDDDLADVLVARYASTDRSVRSSMLQDREAGRTLEYDALNGAVLRAGRRLSVPTPLHDVLHALLGAASEGRGPAAAAVPP